MADSALCSTLCELGINDETLINDVCSVARNAAEVCCPLNHCWRQLVLLTRVRGMSTSLCLPNTHSSHPGSDAAIS